MPAVKKTGWSSGTNGVLREKVEATDGALDEDTGVNVGVCSGTDWGVGASDKPWAVAVDGVTVVDAGAVKEGCNWED